MSRKNILIPLEKTGIISQVDLTDIPDHYVSDSININPNSKIGELEPIRDKSVTTATTSKVSDSVYVETDYTVSNGDILIADEEYIADYDSTKVGTKAELTGGKLTDVVRDNLRIACIKENNSKLIYRKNYLTLGGVSWYTVAKNSGGYKSNVYHPNHPSSTFYYYPFIVYGNLLPEVHKLIVEKINSTPNTEGRWAYILDNNDINALNNFTGTDKFSKEVIIKWGSLDTGLRIRRHNDESFNDNIEGENCVVLCLPPNDRAIGIATKDISGIVTQPTLFQISGLQNQWISNKVGNDQPIDKDSEYTYRFSFVLSNGTETPLSQYQFSYRNTNNNNISWIAVQSETFFDLDLGDIVGMRVYRKRRDTKTNFVSPYYEIGYHNLQANSDYAALYRANTQYNYILIAQPDGLQIVNSSDKYVVSPGFRQASYYTFWADDVNNVGNRGVSGSKSCAVSNGIVSVNFDGAQNGIVWRRRMIVVDDTRGDGNSYSVNSGLLESDVEYKTPEYKKLEVLGDYSYISGIKNHKELGELGDYSIVRSKANAPDVFNIYNDIVRLPEKVTWLKAFLGRLYAFTEHTIYVLTIDLYIEEVIKGIGCSANKGKPIVIEQGMFFAGTNAAYWYDGKQLMEITDVVKNDYIKDYVSNPMPMLYSTYNKCILFPYYKNVSVTEGGSPVTYTQLWVLVFHIPSKQWYKWILVTRLGSEAQPKLFTTYKPITGNGNISDVWLLDNYEKKIYQALVGDYMNNAEIVSKEYGDLQDKKWYKFKIEGTTTGKHYSVDGGSYITLTSSDDLGNVKAKKLKFKIVFNTVIKSIELIYRSLVGLR